MTDCSARMECKLVAAKATTPDVLLLQHTSMYTSYVLLCTCGETQHVACYYGQQRYVMTESEQVC